MWKNKVFSKTTRLVVSIFIGLIIVGSMGNKGTSSNKIEDSYGRTFYPLQEKKDYFRVDKEGNFRLQETVTASGETFVFTGKLGKNGVLIPDNEMKYKSRIYADYSYFLNEYEFIIGKDPDDSKIKEYIIYLKQKGYQTVDFKTNRREWKTNSRAYYSSGEVVQEPVVNQRIDDVSPEEVSSDLGVVVEDNELEVISEPVEEVEEVVFEESPSEELQYFKIEDPDGYTNMRDAPGGSIIRRVLPNEKFRVTGVLDNYKIVRFDNGETGYIHNSRVVKY